MKQIVIYISELVLCALAVCFCVQNIFQKDGESWNMLQNIAGQVQIKESVTENDLRLKQVLRLLEKTASVFIYQKT